jgi:hypothetical protein
LGEDEYSYEIKNKLMQKIFILITAVIFYFDIHAQNVGIGTISPAGKLHIKGSADTSQLTVDANAVQTMIHPLIRLRNAAGIELMDINSDHSSNTFVGYSTGRSNNATLGGTSNTFIGSVAGFSNSTGNDNTAMGTYALYFNTWGYQNTSIGSSTLFSNTTGYLNSAFGSTALLANTTGTQNTGTGAFSLRYNTTGFSNTATGEGSLYANTTGGNNTAGGASALYSNTTGNYNTAFGSGALAQTTASFYNTAIGYQAGDSWDNGYNNVFVGANVDVNGQGYYNVIAIGQGTTVGGSSIAVFGNSATAAYYGYANWTNISDGRYKKNIKENVPGLDFIKKLRPITYNLKATELDAFLHKNDKKQRQMNDAAMASHNKALQEKEAITYTGFSAQDVEAAAKELGFNFSGVDAPNNENGVYGLRYADFVVPLVKAIQEQQIMIEKLSKELEQTRLTPVVGKTQQIIETLIQQNADLQKRIADLEKRVNDK